MKFGSTKAALGAMLKLKARKAADIEQTIREVEGMASELDRLIKAEEDLAKSASQRRDNLRASAAGLKAKLEEAECERDDALEQLNRADVPALTQARVARPRSA